jgi:hypothetical protein
MTRRKAWIPHLGLLLLAMSIIAILALLYYASKTAQPPPQQPPAQIQPPQPAQPPQNITQPQPPETPKPKPPTITATIEASQGGRVLANGTATTAWSSTSPFTLVLEAVPDKCMALDHWLINGTIKQTGTRLSLTIAGNTTVRAVFARAKSYWVLVDTNSSWTSASINGTAYALPHELQVPACSVLVIVPRETEKTYPLNKTLTILVTGNMTVKLYYHVKLPPWARFPVVVGGRVVQLEAKWDPEIPCHGVFEVSQDGWVHMDGFFLLFVQVPWNYTRVVVRARGVHGDLCAFRYCEWGEQPIAYGHCFAYRSEVTFIGCRTTDEGSYIEGKRYPDEPPGAIRIGLIGEAWVRIEAYP